MKNLDKNNKTVKVGEIYYTTLAENGSVQSGHRPVVVLQNNRGNSRSPNVTVAPLTGKWKKLYLPTHVPIEAKPGGLRENSTVLCENLITIPQSDLENYVTKLSDADIGHIAESVLLATGLGSFINIDDMERIQKKADKLNNVTF